MSFHAHTCCNMSYIPIHAVTCPYIPIHAVTCPYIPIHAVTCHFMAIHAVTCQYMAIHAVTCHFMPIHAVTCQYMPIHAITCHFMPMYAQSFSPSHFAHMICGDVASTSSKTLSERPHHDVHISWVTPPVLDHSPSCFSHGSNAVCLIQVQICLWINKHV